MNTARGNASAWIYSDIFLVSVLNFVAAYVSWFYVGVEISFPDFFVVLHLLVGTLAMFSLVCPRLIPYALALASGVAIGRGLGIWDAMAFGNSYFPGPTLLLAGCQWVVLAWVIRPSSLLDPYVKELSSEHKLESKQ